MFASVGALVFDFVLAIRFAICVRCVVFNSVMAFIAVGSLLVPSSSARVACNQQAFNEKLVDLFENIFAITENRRNSLEEQPNLQTHETPSSLRRNPVLTA